MSDSHGGRKKRKFRSLASLEDLVKKLPDDMREDIERAAEEVREILSRVAETGGVIYISKLAERITVLDVEATDPGLQELILLAADKEESESGVDLKTLVVPKVLEGVSRFYIPSLKGMPRSEAWDIRKEWAKALDNVHAHFWILPVNDDDPSDGFMQEDAA